MKIALILLVVLFYQPRSGWSSFFGGGSCSFDTCVEEYEVYSPFFPQLNNSFVCDVIERAIECLDNVTCSGISLSVQKALIEDRRDFYHCSGAPTVTPHPTPTPTSLPPTTVTPSLGCSMDALPCDSPLGDCCPLIPSLPCPSIDLDPGNTQPESVHEECNKIPLYGEMQHCSMFTYSHIRPFGAYGNTLQTCALPGSWYMIKHANFSIEVESESEGIDSPHTKLSKVNVTYFDDVCSERQSYVAYSTHPLPNNFTSGFVPVNTGSPLQLNVTSNGSVASLLATWLNMSVIIRNHFGHLSITVQVPGRLIFDTEGLCNGGCPHHTYFDIDKFRDEESEQCAVDYNNALTYCFTSLANKNGLSEFMNTTYYYLCVFDVLKTHDLQMLSMMVAVGEDALQLPDVGFVVRPPTRAPPVVTEPTTDEEPTPSKTREPTSSRTITEPTTDEEPTPSKTREPTSSRTIPLATSSPPDPTLGTVSSQVAVHSSLHVLTVLMTLLIALALR